MSIVLLGSTSGSCTLQEQAVAGTTVLTLPTTSGTVATLTTPSFATTIGVGGATAAASGAGITFPASQSASSDANTLDDYEEGTWTGTIKGTTTDPTTPVTATGTYTKIGRVVTVGIAFNNFASTGITGNLNVSGLPFTCSNNQRHYLGAADNGGITGTSSARAMVENNTTNVQFVNGANFIAAVATTGCYLWFEVTYFV